MSKSAAQLENEKAVRKVMAERGYGLFNEKELEEIDKSQKKKKRIVFVVIFIILLSIPIVSFVVSGITNNQLAHANAGLRDCLKEIETSPNLPENSSDEETRENARLKLIEDTRKMECHKNNKTEKYDDAVSDLSENIEIDNLVLCLSNATINYATSNEEIESAKSDVQATLVILKRWDSKYATQIDCYDRYRGTRDFQSEISTIQADKRENQSYIDMANNEIKNQSNYGRYYDGNRSLYCSTNSIGSYSWTNCY